MKNQLAARLVNRLATRQKPLHTARINRRRAVEIEDHETASTTADRRLQRVRHHLRGMADHAGESQVAL